VGGQEIDEVGVKECSSLFAASLALSQKVGLEDHAIAIDQCNDEGVAILSSCQRVVGGAQLWQYHQLLSLAQLVLQGQCVFFGLRFAISVEVGAGDFQFMLSGLELGDEILLHNHDEQAIEGALRRTNLDQRVLLVVLILQALLALSECWLGQE
jgi:hypothetical protein